MKRLLLVAVWVAWTAANYGALRHAIQNKYPMQWTQGDRATILFISAVCPVGTAFAVLSNAVEHWPFDLNKPASW